MREIELVGFRMLAAAMAGAPTDWQWHGAHMSQHMYGITEERARAYAAMHGGTASPLSAAVAS